MGFDFHGNGLEARMITQWEIFRENGEGCGKGFQDCAESERAPSRQNRLYAQRKHALYGPQSPLNPKNFPLVNYQ
jgi:hypothetical protein